MPLIATRTQVWLLNTIASATRYIAERTLPESVPLLVHRAAVLDSVEHAKEVMSEAYPFLDRYKGLTLSIREALRRFPQRGSVLEFGVYKGQMINFQAKNFPDIQFIGFDNFTGLRENWRGMAPVNSYDLSGQIPKSRSNVAYVKGWFNESVPAWKAKTTNKAPLLVHVDCDTYEATVDTLNLCAEYVADGLIFHFDDYFGFPNWRNSGYKALVEIANEKSWRLTYLSYGTKEASFLAEV